MGESIRMTSHLTAVFLILSCTLSLTLSSGLNLGASLAALSSRANVTSQGESSWYGWCGNTHYYGAPTPHREWQDCVAFCEEFEQEEGLTYYLADAQEQEEWECVKEMMTTSKKISDQTNPIITGWEDQGQRRGR